MNRKVHFHTTLGDFTAEIFEDKAPITAANFLKLVEENSMTALFSTGLSMTS